MIFEREGEHLTVAEAAEVLDLTKSAVYKQVERKRIWAQRVGKAALFIPRAEVERYARAMRGRPGPPRQAPTMTPSVLDALQPYFGLWDRTTRNLIATASVEAEMKEFVRTLILDNSPRVVIGLALYCEDGSEMATSATLIAENDGLLSYAGVPS